MRQSMNNLRALIKGAKKPAMLAGHGIRAARSENEFLQLIDKLQIPVITTWRGMDLIGHDHPLFLGRTGILNHKKAKDYLDECDLIICIGARLDYCQVNYDHATFAPNAEKVLVDIDQDELDKLPDASKENGNTYRNWIKTKMDAKEFINELLRK
jgi:acetolactate synthase-1/2/3 large subunit